MYTRSSWSLSACLFFATSLIGGCGGPPAGGSSVCEEAAAHLADCTGGSAAPVTSCGGEAASAAEGLLAQSCEEVLTPGGKADNSVGCALAILPWLVGGCCLDRQCSDGKVCSNFLCRTPIGAGATCSNNSICGNGLTCLPSKRCGAPLAAGATCEEAPDCQQGLVCDPSSRCAPPAADLASCRANEQCQHTCIASSCAPRSGENGPCDDGGDCDGPSLSCIGNVCRAAALGSDCATSNDCTGTGLALTCQFGKCGPSAAHGAACDRTAGFGACASRDDTCWGGTCESRHAQGGECIDMFDCVQGFCTDQRCAG